MTALKIIILTTDTPHHLYFAWKLRECFSIEGILLETKSLQAPFDIFHTFEAQRDAYERDHLLAGFGSSFGELADTKSIESLNTPDACKTISSFKPDIAIVFGTSRLSLPIIRLPSVACLNLHGGNPEMYRGLDSQLWAIYHNDFANLATTLHYVAVGLDTGDIVANTRLLLTRETRLHELRSINTRACAVLSVRALSCLESTGRLSARPQLQRGRYYSFMPSVLKEDCLRKFQRHVSKL